MDKLAKRLKSDAERIDVGVSAELESRIAASLCGVTPQSDAAAPERHSGTFWLASTLTGVLAALALVAVINSKPQGNDVPRDVPTVSPVAAMPSMPVIDLKTESAVLASPLRQELEALQADIKKAERKVRRDIGL